VTRNAWQAGETNERRDGATTLSCRCGTAASQLVFLLYVGKTEKIGESRYVAEIFVAEKHVIATRIGYYRAKVTLFLEFSALNVKQQHLDMQETAFQIE
jgi:hypothetical protein